jgi:hypothetical protein
MKRPEEIIHKTVVLHLLARAYPDVFFWHTPNGGKRHIAEAAKFKAMGVVAGIPDILILKGGRLYALELKAPGGRLSPAQRLVGPRMEKCGATISVAKSIDEALVTLEYWGILKRSVASALNPTAGEDHGQRTQLKRSA